MAFHSGRGSMRVTQPFSVVAALVALLAVGSTPAHAAFHLWNLNQVYTNSSGTVQYIELRDTNGGQNSVGGNQIQVTNMAGTQTHTFMLPAGVLSGNTLNHDLLFATVGAQAAGAPAPDFTLPDNFLFSGGGTISFFGANSGSYAALPVDGTHARDWTAGTDVANSPTNYAGQSSVIAAPEPVTLGLLALGGLGVLRRRDSRRRR